MKAAVCDRWGSPEGVVVHEVPDPTPGEGELLVRVAFASLNGADAEMLTGRPLYSRVGRPRGRVLGSDLAGTVVAVGPGVSRFAAGDEVIGEVFERFGALAELVCVPEDRLVRKPAELSFELACALPQAGVLALQGVDHVEPGTGAQVLLVGAGGGIGVFTLQLTKRRGAVVTALDNGGKLEALRGLGADRVVDYTTTDVLADGRRYDLILDVVGRGSPRAFRRALTPKGAYLVVGGPLLRVLLTLVYGAFVRWTGGPTIKVLAWDRSLARIEEVVRLAPELGDVIGARCPLDEASEGLARLVDRQAVGKVVVELRP